MNKDTRHCLQGDIPWSGRRLIVGNGVYAKLPITPPVEAEPKRRGIELVAVPKKKACQLVCSVRCRECLSRSVSRDIASDVLTVLFGFGQPSLKARGRAIRPLTRMSDLRNRKKTA